MLIKGGDERAGYEKRRYDDGRIIKLDAKDYNK